MPIRIRSGWMVAAAFAMVIAVATTISAQDGPAGDDHDFRTDHAAFFSVKPFPPLVRNGPAASPAPAPQVDPDFLRQKLSQLSGELPIDADGKRTLLPDRKAEPHKAVARGFLSAEYRSLGFRTEIQQYSFGNNFIAEKAGTDPSRVLLLTSHLDSVQCPGADDDGTGTVSALAIARALGPQTFKHTLRVVAFDQEEPGKIGSFRYVESLSDEERARILGVINLEMTGFNGRKDGVFHLIDCGRADSAFVTQAVREAVADLDLPIAPTAACTQRSDHARFWQAGIPAIMVIQNFFGGDANPCYHKPCDTTDRIDFDYMAAITRGVAEASFRLLEPESPAPDSH